MNKIYTKGTKKRSWQSQYDMHAMIFMDILHSKFESFFSDRAIGEAFGVATYHLGCFNDFLCSIDTVPYFVLSLLLHLNALPLCG